eukprot:scaffold7675_cov95-Isochrysis_galbana.AAC.2
MQSTRRSQKETPRANESSTCTRKSSTSKRGLSALKAKVRSSHPAGLGVFGQVVAVERPICGQGEQHRGLEESQVRDGRRVPLQAIFGRAEGRVPRDHGAVPVAGDEPGGVAPRGGGGGALSTREDELGELGRRGAAPQHQPGRPPTEGIGQRAGARGQQEAEARRGSGRKGHSVRQPRGWGGCRGRSSATRYRCRLGRFPAGPTRPAWICGGR